MATTVKISGANAVFYVRALKDMQEVVIDGTVYTRMDGDCGVEIKVSPHGTEGDYDKGAAWVYYCDIPTLFEEEKTYILTVD